MLSAVAGYNCGSLWQVSRDAFLCWQALCWQEPLGLTLT